MDIRQDSKGGIWKIESVVVFGPEYGVCEGMTQIKARRWVKSRQAWTKTAREFVADPSKWPVVANPAMS
jgi:hypothetical protein